MYVSHTDNVYVSNYSELVDYAGGEGASFESMLAMLVDHQHRVRYRFTSHGCTMYKGEVGRGGEMVVVGGIKIDSCLTTRAG